MKSAKTIERMFHGFYTDLSYVERGLCTTIESWHLYRGRWATDISIHIQLTITDEPPNDTRLKREWMQVQELRRALQNLPRYNV